MSGRIIIGDALEALRGLPSNSIDCCVTSPPYWGLRDYGVAGQMGLEATLGEHLAAMVAVFEEVRRVLTPSGTCWINYGDCYATKPNGRSAADTKVAGNDDRTFRDKPFSTVGAIYVADHEAGDRRGATGNKGSVSSSHGGRIVSGGTLKPKDLCLVPNRIAIALQDAGWWVRSEIIWAKPNPMPDSSGRYRPSTAHEKIWLLTKSGKSFYDSEAVRIPAATGRLHAVSGWAGHGMTKAEQQESGRLLRNCEPDLSAIVPPEVWTIATAAFSDAHFATFPPALVAPCIMAGCPQGGTVLDPFFGAGTTGLVADRLQREWIGIELNPDFAALARRRIEDDRGGLADLMDAAA